MKRYSKLTLGDILKIIILYIVWGWWIVGFVIGIIEFISFIFTGDYITIKDFNKIVYNIKVKKAHEVVYNVYIEALRNNLYIKKEGFKGETELIDKTKVIKLIKELGYEKVTLLAISDYVNHSLVYTDDKYRYGLSDKIGSLKEIIEIGRGDCDDYALTGIRMKVIHLYDYSPFYSSSYNSNAHLTTYYKGKVYDYGKVYTIEEVLKKYELDSYKIERLYFK